MEPSASGFCTMAACFKPGVTLKGLRGWRILLLSKNPVCLILSLG